MTPLESLQEIVGKLKGSGKEHNQSEFVAWVYFKSSQHVLSNVIMSVQSNFDQQNKSNVGETAAWEGARAGMEIRCLLCGNTLALVKMIKTKQRKIKIL